MEKVGNRHAVAKMVPGGSGCTAIGMHLAGDFWQWLLEGVA